jgi:organic radical activating enzyme
MTKYFKVGDLFTSIQGEGFFAGTPACFVRFYGCNLKCSWCDTKQPNYMEWSEEILFEQIQRIAGKINHLVFTGGEPSLQPIASLIYLCQLYGHYFVQVETNGTSGGRLDSNLARANWITASPKAGFNRTLEADEIKIVLDEKINPNYIRSFVEAKHYYIQPCSENFEPAIKFVKEDPTWKLSIQLQKIINIK